MVDNASSWHLQSGDGSLATTLRGARGSMPSASHRNGGPPFEDHGRGYCGRLRPSGQALPARAQHDVPDDVRKDGTYVAPHWESTSDHSYNNNWSTSPNVSPFTWQQGARQPPRNDRAPEPQPAPLFNPSLAPSQSPSTGGR